MSTIPQELKYVVSHEWLRLEDDGLVTIGITEHAQELLGDIVFVELPVVGTQFVAEEQAGVVESVKAASDIYAPISGEVVEINENLLDTPEIINEDPYQAAWFFKVRPENLADLETLLTADAYAQEIGE